MAGQTEADEGRCGLFPHSRGLVMAPNGARLQRKSTLWPGRPREAKVVGIPPISLFVNGMEGIIMQEGTSDGWEAARLGPAPLAAPGGQASIMAISGTATSSHYCSCGLGDTKQICFSD